MAKPSLVRNRKFRRALNALGVPRPHLLGHLEMMWHSAYEAGHDELGDSLDVELAAEWEGERGAFAEALVDAGFLIENDGKYRVHELLENAPGYVKERWRKREWRAEKKKKVEDPSGTVRDKSGTVVESMPVPLSPPFPTPNTDTDSLRSSVGPEPADPAPDKRPVFEFPIKGKGRTWSIDSEIHDELVEAFPDLDAMGEYRKAKAWLVANSKRQKTANGMPRFLYEWLSREQNNGRRRDGPQKTTSGGAWNRNTGTKELSALSKRMIEGQKRKEVANG